MLQIEHQSLAGREQLCVHGVGVHEAGVHGVGVHGAGVARRGHTCVHPATADLCTPMTQTT